MYTMFVWYEVVKLVDYVGYKVRYIEPKIIAYLSLLLN